MLARWVNELYPEDDVYLPVRPTRLRPLNQKSTSGCHGTLYTTSISQWNRQTIGVSRAVLYKWKDEIIGNSATRLCVNITNLPWRQNAMRCGGSRPTESGNTPPADGAGYSKKAEEIIKKDPGISISHLNKEKKQRSLMPWDKHIPWQNYSCSGPCP